MRHNLRKRAKISFIFILVLILFGSLSTFAIYRETKSKNISLNISKPAFTVSFNSNGGTGGQTEDVVATYGESMPAINTTAPNKERNNFLGWYDSLTGGTKYYNANGTSARTFNKTTNTTLYAHWEETAYTISFNPNGGTVSPTYKIVEFGDPLRELPTPTKSGKEFSGWFTDITTGTLVTSSTVPAASVTYFAHWVDTIAKGAIYDANGGSFGVTSVTNVVEYDESSVSTTKYSHTANMDDSGVATSTYAASLNQTDTVTIEGATSLKIDVWYSTYNSSNYLAIYPKGVTPTTSNYSSATISGGKLYGHGSYTGYTKPDDADTTYHKIYIVNDDTATFYFYSNTSSSRYYGYYAVVTAYTENYKEPTRTGYTFNNWNTSSDASGTSYTSEQDIIDYVNTNNSVLRLYADWVAKTYTITLNKNGATNSPTSSLTSTYDSSLLTPSSITVPEKVYTTTINTTLDANRNSDGATITGDTTAKSITYTFDGWTTSSSGGTKVINNSSTPALISGISGYTDSTGNWIKDGNTTLYAKWIDPSTTTVTLPKIIKTNFKCGWTNVSTSDEIATINGTKLNSEATFPPDATYTLYPVCELDNYFELTYDANDGYFGYPVTTSPTTTNKVTYTKDGNTVTAYADGVKYREYKKPIRDGYRFDGWATSKTATTPTYTDEEAAKAIVQTTGSATLYAVWTRVWAENLSYDNTKTGVNCSDAQCMLDYLATKLTNKGTTKFKIGDLVQVTPQNSSYTTKTKYTGYSSTQTINPKELNLWRVIRVNSDGTYDAVSEYVSSTNVTFKGTTGYQSFVGYLNILASKYENPKYTVGSRIMGYNGQTEFISDTSYFDGTDLKVGTEWKSSTSGTLAEEYLGRGDSLYQIDYKLVKAAYGGTSRSYAIANKVGTSTATGYWLGSRYYDYGTSTNFYFEGRYVYTNGDTLDDLLREHYGPSWDALSNSHALRPIITLRSGLRGTGSGTASDPYVLQ